MKTLYAIMTHNCNLSCPHCVIKDQPDGYDHEKFMKQLNSFDGVIILFGGEPTVHKDRMLQILTENRDHGNSKIGSIATNMIKLEDWMKPWYQEIQYLSTSWNQTRFTQLEYIRWMNNLVTVGEWGLKPGIIITLTDDLIDKPPEDLVGEMMIWPSESIGFVRFEHYIGPEADEEYLKRADDWLCKLYELRHHINLRIETFDKNITWYHDCADVWTLEPNGRLTNTCPNGLYNRKNIIDKCMTCEHAIECMPCRLQRFCSYPHQLRKLLESEE